MQTHSYMHSDSVMMFGTGKMRVLVNRSELERTMNIVIFAFS